MNDNNKLPPTQYLILEVLAARYRTGEHLWTFPVSVGKQLRELEAAGLVSLMNGVAPRTHRAKLTEKGIRATIETGYSPPHLTLAEAIDTLPVTNDDMFAWVREHGLSLSAGCGAVINSVRDDLRKLAGGQP